MHMCGGEECMYVGSGVNVKCTPVCEHMYKSQRKASGTPFIISLIIPLQRPSHWAGSLPANKPALVILLPSLRPHGLHVICTSLSPVLGLQGNRARRELGTSCVFIKHVISCLRVLSTEQNTHSSIFRPHHNGECKDNMLSFLPPVSALWTQRGTLVPNVTLLSLPGLRKG